jgi:hypothetical protein
MTFPRWPGWGDAPISATARGASRRSRLRTVMARRGACVSLPLWGRAGAGGSLGRARDQSQPRHSAASGGISITRGTTRRSRSGPSRWGCGRRSPTAACLDIVHLAAEDEQGRLGVDIDGHALVLDRPRRADPWRRHTRPSRTRPEQPLALTPTLRPAAPLGLRDISCLTRSAAASVSVMIAALAMTAPPRRIRARAWRPRTCATGPTADPRPARR